MFTTVEFPDIPRFSKPHFLRETVESRSLRGVVGCCCSKWKSRVSLLFLGGGREKGVWCGKEDATRIYCAFLPFTFTYTHTPEKKGENTLFSRHCNNGTAWLIVKRSWNRRKRGERLPPPPRFENPYCAVGKRRRRRRRRLESSSFFHIFEAAYTGNERGE